MGLGINKDLEPLARRVRRLGGSVEVTRSTHVRWVLPDGQVITTGLTMHDTTARQCIRRIEAALRGPASPAGYRVEEGGGGRFVVVLSRTGEPVLNSNGHVSTFKSRERAEQHAKLLEADVPSTD